MFVKDLVNNAIYRWTNQKLQTVLAGRTAIVSAVNFALDDIYTYEWKEWTFMYNKNILEWEPTDDKTIVITLDKPIKKMFILKSLNEQHPIKEYKINVIEPTVGVDDLKENEIYFKPWTKQLYIPNNDNKWYVLHWVSFFNTVDWDSEIPLPDHFMWLLYNMTMCYLYPITWQYWDNKETNTYNVAQTQLVNLAKTDAFQLNSVIWNIH